MNMHAFVPSGTQVDVGEGNSEPLPRTEADTATVLVPNSFIQFLDFTLSGATAAAIRRSFLEDRTAAEPALYPVSIEDGLLYHPLTGAVADTALTITLSGARALEPFLDTWLPVPMMRVRPAATGDTWQELDEGPSNWARVFISRIACEDAEPSYRVVLALDTTCDKAGAAEGRPYAAPTVEDVRAGSVFRFSDEEGDVAWFVSEAWVDDWIREIHQARKPADPEADPLDTNPASLEYLACYLTLLATLGEACGFPDIRFIEPKAERGVVGVDLVLDIGHAGTAAFVREATRGARGARNLAPVPIRDLSEPWRVHDGVIPSRVEFMVPAFGREALSRLSGRTNAFLWPSLARVGIEAERLAADQQTTDAPGTPASPMRYLWDETESAMPWRFARSADGSKQRGGLVCGPQLAHVRDDGSILDAKENVAAPIKPRFSRASLSTFLAAEVLAHTLGHINSPARRGIGARSTLPRRIERILVTTPAGLLEAEKATLQRRLQDAVKLIWQAPGLAEGMTANAPRRPEIQLVNDNATNTQLVWLHNEIAVKFQHRAREYFQLLGKQRPDHPGGRSVRVACLDVGAGTTGLSVATYQATDATPVVARLDLCEGTRIGSDDVAKAIVERHLLPALREELAECQLPGGDAFLAEILSGEARGRPGWLKGFGRRFTRDLAHPVAMALLKSQIHASDLDADVSRRHTIGSLLAMTGVSAKTIAEELDLLAADEGATAFSCLSVPLAIRGVDLAATVKSVIAPIITGAARVFEALDCDIVLLSGWLAGLPAVSSGLIEAMPMRPGQIVSFADYRIGTWYPGRSTSGKVGDTKPLAAIGAAIATSEHGLAGAPFDIRPRLDDNRTVSVGLMGRDGLVRDAAAIFTSGESEPETRSRSPGAQMASVLLEPDAVLGLRRLPLETWPATPIGTLQTSATKRRQRLKLPLKATLELAAEPGGERLRLLKVQDAAGVALAPSECELRFQTQPNAEGYWLDTGAITHSSQETDA